MADAPAARDPALRMRYRIGRGETGVLSFEPYKSALLPLWRFRAPAAARDSAAALQARFRAYDEAGDFVGMDMARKFLQMGMTRARRYANYRGGRKYDVGADGAKSQRDKSEGHEGRAEKVEASRIFREAWERCKEDKGYRARKEAFVKEQREWDRRRKAEGG